MYNIKKNIIVVILAILLFGSISVAQAALPIYYPVQGGTGTSTIPTVNQIPVGFSNGTYGPVSTTTLASLLTGTTSATALTNFWTGSLSGNINNANTSNVGIGTASPGSKLEVLSSGLGTTYAATIKSGTTGILARMLRLYGNNAEMLDVNFNDTAASELSILSVNSGTPLGFRTTGNGNILLNPDGTGNVGIGTTTPTKTLSVAGTGYFGNRLLVNASPDDGSTALQVLGGMSFTNDIVTSGLGGGVFPVVRIGGNTTPDLVDISGGYGIGIASYSESRQLVFSASTPATSGDVGISRFGAGVLKVTDGTSGFGTLIAGKIGIGTTTPGDRLSIEDGSSGDSPTVSLDRMNNTTQSKGFGYIFKNLGLFRGGIIADKVNSNVNIWDATSTIALSVTTTGNVGIGSTSPVSLLGVAGTATVQNINTYSALATSTFLGGVDLKSANVVQHTFLSFTFSSTTAITGTTTLPMGPAAVNETWNNVKCFTDTGTALVTFSDGTNKMNSASVTSSVANTTLSTNNTFTPSEKRYVDIGTPASSPTAVSCTVDKTVNL